MKWLILDSDWLCYRSFYATGHLQSGDVLTGMVFGYLQSCRNLLDEVNADSIVHCFNHGRNLRQIVFNDYKKKRKEKQKATTPEEKEAWKEFSRQRNLLKTEYLTELGYSNVLFHDGFEGDDIMAAVALDIPPHDVGVLITSDHDMYQCIRSNVDYYNPNKNEYLTEKKFVQQNGISPTDYWKVLVIAGCATDEVPGIQGVGKATAIRYLQGKLKPTSKKYKDIKETLPQIKARNKELVKLPMPECPRNTIHPDDITQKKWNGLCKRLGFKTLRMR